MKHLTRTPSSIRLAAQACLLALALANAPAAHAVVQVPADKPEAALDVALAKKAAVRAHAEKQRALREAKELDVVANVDQPAQTAPAGAAPVAAPAPNLVLLPSDSLSKVQALGERFGTANDVNARMAGFLTGLVGNWAPALTPGAAPLLLPEAESAALVADYAWGADAGHYSRLGFGALLGAGVLILIKKFLSRRKSRVSRLSRPTAKPTRISDKPHPTGKSMFSIFGRRKKATAKHEPAEAVVVAFDMDTLRDYAFNLLFARGRHDLAGVGDMVTPNFARCLMSHFQALENKGHWNKVERVCSLKCEEVESWVEGEISFAKLHVSWKALDYIVNYNRRPGDHGYMVEGDANKMESFEEEWVVTRRAGESWLVDAMYPATKTHVK